MLKMLLYFFVLFSLKEMAVATDSLPQEASDQEERKEKEDKIKRKIKRHPHKKHVHLKESDDEETSDEGDSNNEGEQSVPQVDSEYIKKKRKLEQKLEDSKYDEDDKAAFKLQLQTLEEEQKKRLEPQVDSEYMNKKRKLEKKLADSKYDEDDKAGFRSQLQALENEQKRKLAELESKSAAERVAQKIENAENDISRATEGALGLCTSYNAYKKYPEDLKSCTKEANIEDESYRLFFTTYFYTWCTEGAYEAKTPEGKKEQKITCDRITKRYGYTKDNFYDKAQELLAGKLNWLISLSDKISKVPFLRKIW